LKPHSFAPPILPARFAPDGQISKNLSSPFRKNISVFPKLKSGYMICHPVPKEGRIAIVTDAGGDAVDATASAQAVSQGD
jgi:hypothetical protein